MANVRKYSTYLGIIRDIKQTRFILSRFTIIIKVRVAWTDGLAFKVFDRDEAVVFTGPSVVCRLFIRHSSYYLLGSSSIYYKYYWNI